MEDNQNNWLPHLIGAVPKAAYGYKTCIYTIALEGWRRGLELKFINRFNTGNKPPIKYSLSDGNKEYIFAISRANTVPKEAIKVSIDKNKTKEVLSNAGVSVPEGEYFGIETPDKDIVAYAESLGFPLVLKPSDAGGGAGVFTNITNVESFETALNTLRNQLNYKNVMVERYVLGYDYRIYVLDQKVIGAFKRMPANVIGDGQTAVKDLIVEKNNIRKKSPFLFYKPIKIDDKLTSYLKQSGLDIEYIPKEGERVYLRDKGDFAAGGDPVEVTDDLTEEIKNIAINAANAVPGFVQCAVDMIVDEENNYGVVNELNSKAQISNHLFPIEGTARDVPKEIIDFYFPETKDIERNERFYFDLKSTLDSFQNGYAKEVTVPNLPKGKSAKRFVISGSFGEVDYRKWVQNKAKNLRLNGYVKLLKNGDISIVVAGLLKDINAFKLVVEDNAPQNVTVSKVIEKNWNNPVKVGFEIKGKAVRNQQNNLKISQEEKERLDSENKQLLKKKSVAEKKYVDMKNSTSWQITKPVRLIGKVVKRMGSNKK